MSSKSRTMSTAHADHSAELTRLRKVSGQIQGIEKMIQENRYCPEILQQIRAVTSAMKAIEVSILGGHMEQCLKEAAQLKEPGPFQRKISEILRLMRG